MLVNGVVSNTISIRDRGLLYGDGVFRTIAVINGRLQLWSYHYAKLQHDCVVLKLTCPSSEQLLQQITPLLTSDCNLVLKLIVTRGEGARGYAIPPTSNSSCIWDSSPLPSFSAQWYQQGVVLMLCQTRLATQPRLAGIKHLNRLEQVLAASELSSPAVEGLLCDEQGYVIEGTRTNLFMVSNQQLFTPDLSYCGVAGIQRERVLLWAAAHGWPVHIKKITLAELLAADEVFLVNSLIGVWPVASLLQSSWSHFPLAWQLQRDLQQEYL